MTLIYKRETQTTVENLIEIIEGDDYDVYVRVRYNWGEYLDIECDPNHLIHELECHSSEDNLIYYIKENNSIIVGYCG